MPGLTPFRLLLWQVKVASELTLSALPTAAVDQMSLLHSVNGTACASKIIKHFIAELFYAKTVDVLVAISACVV